MATNQDHPLAAVRPARPPDTPGIHALIREVFAEYDCKLDVENEERHLIDPGGYFRAHDGEFWVVERDGLIRATGAVLLHPDAGELKTLYVHASLRRQGWGEKLTKMAMDYARAAGKRRFILWSDTRFLDAHRLYRRMGFRQLDGTRVYPDSNNSIEFGFEMPLH